MAVSSFLSLRPSTSQDVAYTGTSATVTNAFGTQTYAVRIVSTSACRYRIVEAAGGAAVATDAFLPASWVEYVSVTPGQKISAIKSTTNGLVTATDGTLNVVELT